MSRSRELVLDFGRWIQFRCGLAKLCIAWMLVAIYSVTAVAGTPGPEADSSFPAVPSSSAQLKLLWKSRQSLFVAAQPTEARQEAAAVLQMTSSGDLEIRAEALFVEMEAAVLQRDDAGITHAASQLCDLRSQLHPDARVQIAAFRLASGKNRMIPLEEIPAAQNEDLQASLAPSIAELPSSQMPPGNPVLQTEHQPPCQTRREAAKFFSRLAHYEKPADIRQILGRCAPDLMAGIRQGTSFQTARGQFSSARNTGL
jgi:hypothetical protein